MLHCQEVSSARSVGGRADGFIGGIMGEFVDYHYVNYIRRNF